jgi:hypothetical protein
MMGSGWERPPEYDDPPEPPEEPAELWWLHVACNDRNGTLPVNPPPEVESLNVYVGGQSALEVHAGYPLMFRRLGEIERVEAGWPSGIKFYGVGRFQTHGESVWIGNIHWNAYALIPADVCRLLTSLRDMYHWRAEVGWSAVFSAMNMPSADLSRPIVPDLFCPLVA